MYKEIILIFLIAASSAIAIDVNTTSEILFLQEISIQITNDTVIVSTGCSNTVLNNTPGSINFNCSQAKNFSYTTVQITNQNNSFYNISKDHPLTLNETLVKCEPKVTIVEKTFNVTCDNKKDINDMATALNSLRNEVVGVRMDGERLNSNISEIKIKIDNSINSTNVSSESLETSEVLNIILLSVLLFLIGGVLFLSIIIFKKLNVKQDKDEVEDERRDNGNDRQGGASGEETNFFLGT